MIEFSSKFVEFLNYQKAGNFLFVDFISTCCRSPNVNLYFTDKYYPLFEDMINLHGIAVIAEKQHNKHLHNISCEYENDEITIQFGKKICAGKKCDKKC